MFKKEMFKVNPQNMTGEVPEGEFVPGTPKKSINFGKSLKFTALN